MFVQNQFIQISINDKQQAIYIKKIIIKQWNVKISANLALHKHVLSF